MEHTVLDARGMDDATRESGMRSLLEAHGEVRLRYALPVFWDSSQGQRELEAVAFTSGDGIVFAVGAAGCGLLDVADAADLASRAAIEGLPLIDTTAPVSLHPVHIPKPWGEEIWYTGMEQRGVAGAGNVSASQALPELLSVWPQAMTGGLQRQLVLLKILAPLPNEQLGDLYFELHEEKREVYVVTHVDETAWPDGRGAIRYGFSPEKLAECEDPRDFLRQYRDAVAAYRELREQLDARLDALRQRDGRGINEPVEPDTMSAWLAELPEDLRAEERRRRAAMDSFTGMRSLEVGDVVKVPCFVPHALQHGVRTVEFQTPVYERLILSFGQKVLTQSHWDTEEALEKALLQAPPDEASVVLEDAAGVRRERIVDFKDFEVDRLQLDAGARWHGEIGDYAIAMGVAGDCRVCGQALAPEGAMLLPRSLSDCAIHNAGESPACLLLARPRHGG